MKKQKIKIYLIARISKDAQAWNNNIASAFSRNIFEVFKPHEHNPWNQRHEEFSQKVVDTDVLAIKDSDIGLVLPEFGKDCAWECGYYANSNKLVVVFVDDQIIWLRDWMIKGNINFVVTNNLKTYKILKKDSILRYKKIFLIKEIAELNKILIIIYKNRLGKT